MGIPTATAVVSRYFEARGGRHALAGLHSVERQGEITFYLSEGRECKGRYHTRVAYPDTALIEIVAGKASIREGLIRGASFVYDSTSDVWRPGSAEKSSELIETARVANRELLYEENCWTQGIVQMDGTLAVVHGVADDLQRVIYCFSRLTGLLASKSSGERRREYGDWRDVKGVLFPFSIDDYTADELRQSIRLQQVDHGIEFDARWVTTLMDGNPRKGKQDTKAERNAIPPASPPVGFRR